MNLWKRFWAMLLKNKSRWMTRALWVYLAWIRCMLKYNQCCNLISSLTFLPGKPVAESHIQREDKPVRLSVPFERAVFIDCTWNQTKNIIQDERLKGKGNSYCTCWGSLEFIKMERELGSVGMPLVPKIHHADKRQNEYGANDNRQQVLDSKGCRKTILVSCQHYVK